jgi:uroporphyrinogen decarboxylase
MLPRERVLAALAHQEPDRVPLDIGGTDVTGINVQTYRRLLPLLGLQAPAEIPVQDIVTQLAAIDDTVLERLDAHCRGFYPVASSSWRFVQEEDAEARWFTDEWGITWRMPLPHGHYYDIARHPLAGATLEGVRRHPWPDPTDAARLAGLRELLQAACASGRHAVILSGISGGGPMELGSWLAGFSNFYAALIAEPALADELLDRALEVKLRFWQAVLPEVGDYVDVISESEDLGVQDRLMISPRTFRSHIKPRLRQLIEGIKTLAPQAKVLLHSDGAIAPILCDLIEIGVDILNPVQVSATGMGDTAFLKREFGQDLVFWGAIDTQHVLPFGPPAEVESEVRRRIDDLAPGGGYVMASVHNIQADVPAENIVAMWEAWRRYGNR